MERVGRHDSFFELGGHSLLIVQLISRVQRELGVELRPREVFERPVLKDMATEVGKGRKGGSARDSGGWSTEVCQCSYRWHSNGYGFSLSWNGVASHITSLELLRLRGVLDREALRRALDRVVARHEILRTGFVQVDGHAMQVVGAGGEFPIEVDDLREREGKEAELERLLEEEGKKRFDLERGPLIRGRLVQMGEGEHVLMVTMHHIVSDGWSMGVLVDEVSRLYGAFVKGEGDPLEPLAIQYADYAAWQREWLSGEELRKQSDYWKETLAGAAARLELATDWERPGEQDYRGASIGVELGRELSLEIEALSRRHGVTPYMTMLAGWAATLGRLAGQEEVVIGTPVAGRTRVEIEPLIGFFVNTLAIRVRTGGATTVGELLERTREQVLRAQENQDLPFEQVVELVQPARTLAHAPVFQVMFAWQNAPEGKLELPGLELSSVERVVTTAQFELTLELAEGQGGIQGTLNYATALFERATMERYVEYLRNMLRGMVRDDQETVSRIALMSVEERHQVVEEWNATAVEYASGRCLHELFEEQVERAPEAVAVVCGEESLTYRGAERACESAGASSAEPWRGTRCAGGNLRRAERGDDGGDAWGGEGGRVLCAFGPGISSGATAAHAERQRAGGVADARSMLERARRSGGADD